MQLVRITIAMFVIALAALFATPAQAEDPEPEPPQPTVVTFTNGPSQLFPRVGNTYAPTVASTRNDQPIVLSIATPAKCQLVGGVVTFTAKGACTINADQAGTATHLPGHASKTIIIF